MHRLTGVAEHLDGDLADTDALVGNLRDFARLNRLSGGTRLSQKAIERLEARGPVRTILDVGTGGADIPVALLAAARRSGRELTVTATDGRAEVLDAARAARPGIERLEGLGFAVADGRSLPYPDAAFDVAHASLVLHHLEPEDAVAFLRELRRVARIGVVVNDLVRGWLFWIGTWVVVRAAARSRFTRHDGPLSVRRAYTRRELGDLLIRANLEPLATVVGFAGHRVAIAAR